jgi:hypothetical protein
MNLSGSELVSCTVTGDRHGSHLDSGNFSFNIGGCSPLDSTNYAQNLFYTYYPIFYPNLPYVPVQSKIEQAFKILTKLLAIKMITKELNVKEFIKAVNEIAETL